MKKLFSFILATIILASSLTLIHSSAATSGECGDTLSWSYDENTGTITISGTGQMENYSIGSFNNYQVTSAPWQSLWSEAKIINISDGVESIGSYAFYGLRGLTDIIIGKDVVKIEEGALIDCIFLSSISVSEQNSSYCSKGNCLIDIKEKKLILGCKSSIIPDDGSVNCIGDRAFEYCRITNISIPESITTIGEYAFNGSSLKKLEIKPNITSIGYAAFKDCLFLQDLKINDGVSNLGDSAFSGCIRILSITIPGTIKSINKFAFADCTGLLSINFSEGTQTIEQSAFTRCTNLSSVNFASSITAINDLAFRDCSGLKKLSLPDNINSIGYQAFLGCTSLANLVIPDSITNIGRDSFYGCTGLKSLDVGNGSVTIGIAAFSGCSSLSKITLGENVQIIGRFAFDNCSNLAEIIYKSKNVKDLIDSSVPSGSNEGLCAFGNSGSLSGGFTVEFSSTVNVIPAYLFYKSNLKSIKINESDKTLDIGKGAFYECKNLTEIIINTDKIVNLSVNNNSFYDAGISGEGISVFFSDNVKSIPANMFYALDSNNVLHEPKITSLYLGENVEYIGNRAFYGCSSISSITFPNSLKTIGKNAFTGCSSLTALDLPDSLTKIDEQAFSYCRNLSEINLPDGIEEIGFWAFYYTDYYNDNSNWDNDVLYINNYLIKARKSIGDKYQIKSGTIAVANQAFENCENLIEVVLPDSIYTLGIRTFEGCSSLSIIAIPESINSIGNATFKNCSSIENIYLPLSVSNIETSAFEGCSNIKKVYYSGTIIDREGISIASKNNYLENAKWIYSDIVITFTLNYYANGGTGAPDYQTGNGTITLSKTIPKRSGYSFQGWATESSATLAQYQPGASFNLIQDMDLYAVWKKEICEHSNTSTKIRNNVEPTCEIDGYYEVVTFCTDCNTEISFTPVYVPKLGHSFTNYIYNNNATTEADGTETAKCNRCNITDTRIKHGTKIPSNPDNPYENVSNCSIDAPSGNKTINWKFKAHLWANAYNLPSDYHLAWFENKTMVSNHSEYTTDNLTFEHTYTVKIVDSSNRIVSKPEQEKTVTINVKNDFFSKIISFFMRLFGSDVATI